MDLRPYLPIYGDPARVRFGYVQVRRLIEALEDEGIVRALANELGVELDPEMSTAECQGAIELALHESRRQRTSRWFQVHPAEIIAAALFQADLGRRTREVLFSGRASLRELRAPLMAWLEASGCKVHDRMSFGTARASLVGVRHGSWLTPEEVIRVEVRNDLDTMLDALDELEAASERAHRTYLACTPLVALAYGEYRAEGATWIVNALSTAVTEVGAGLLVIEDGAVIETVPARHRERANVGRALQSLGA